MGRGGRDAYCHAGGQPRGRDHIERTQRAFQGYDTIRMPLVTTGTSAPPSRACGAQARRAAAARALLEAQFPASSGAAHLALRTAQPARAGGRRWRQDCTRESSTVADPAPQRFTMVRDASGRRPALEPVDGVFATSHGGGRRSQWARTQRGCRFPTTIRHRLRRDDVPRPPHLAFSPSRRDRAGGGVMLGRISGAAHASQ